MDKSIMVWRQTGWSTLAKSSEEIFRWEEKEAERIVKMVEQQIGKEHTPTIVSSYLITQIAPGKTILKLTQ